MNKNIQFDEQSPEIMLGLILARARNVCYYCIIDDRPRAQYMHAFRQLKKDIHIVLDKLKGVPELYQRWCPPLVDILKMIPMKAKTEDTRQLGMNIGRYLQTNLNMPLS